MGYAQGNTSLHVSRSDRVFGLTIYCAVGWWWQYAIVIALFLAFQKAFEHWKWEATRPTLSVVRPTKEQALLTHVLANAKSGDAESVVETIDHYCWSSVRNWMMNVGDVKGKILDAEIHKILSARRDANNTQPIIAIEFGTYTGYASVRIARLLDAARGDRLISIEIDANSAKVAQQIVWTDPITHFAAPHLNQSTPLNRCLLCYDMYSADQSGGCIRSRHTNIG